MLKQILALLAFSLAIIFFMTYAHNIIQALMTAHHWIASMLTSVFSSGQAGDISRQLIALLALPILIGLVPTTIYWLVRRNWFPYFMNIVWVVWLVQAGALIILSTAVVQ